MTILGTQKVTAGRHHAWYQTDDEDLPLIRKPIGIEPGTVLRARRKRHRPSLSKLAAAIDADVKAEIVSKKWYELFCFYNIDGSRTEPMSLIKVLRYWWPNRHIGGIGLFI